MKKTKNLKLSKEDKKLLSDCMGALIFLKDDGSIIADQPRQVFVERVVSPLIHRILDRLENP